MKKLRTYIRLHISLIILAVIATVAVALFMIRASSFPKNVRNVLLVSIDTCRADHLSCYGFQPKITPNIDAIAAEGILFEKTFTPTPRTLPSHSSMLTGTIPPYHGVHDNIDYQLAKRNLTLAEIMSQNKYKTAAVVGAYVLDSHFGLSQGFDYYNDRFEDIRNKDYGYYAERRAEEVSRFAGKWLSENKNEPFFLFVHYFDPHSPYEPPPPFAFAHRDNPYTGEIAYTDHCFGLLIKKLKELNLYDSTLIVITADHGEALGEHGEPDHGYFMYNSTLRVPLIVKHPAGPKGLRVNNTVGLIDIVPTILTSVEIPVPPEIQGSDLSAYFRKKTQSEKDRLIYCESLRPTRYNCNGLVGVVTDRWKYIQTTRPELYDLKNDPGEMNNLANKQPQQARIMQDHLKQILETKRYTGQADSKLIMDEESKKRLESLGYVAGGTIDDTFEFDKNKPDPKDYFAYHQSILAVRSLSFSGQFGQAKEICIRMASDYPDIPETYLQLGIIAFKENEFDKAVTYFSKTISLSSQAHDAERYLAWTFKQQGKIDDAIEHYRKAIELQPFYLEAQLELGTILGEQGKLTETIEHYKQALKIAPQHPEFHYNLGVTYMMKGSLSQAANHWEQAARFKKDLIEAHYNLARVLAVYKEADCYNPAKAVVHAETACRLTDYRHPIMLDTLAVTYAAMGRFAEAVETAQRAVNIAFSTGQKNIAEQIQSRIELYKLARPYHEPVPASAFIGPD